MKNLNFQNLILYQLPILLITGLPLFLITGPFLSDLTVSITILIFIYISLKEKKYEYYNTKFFKIFIIFWLYLVINSLLQYPDFYSFQTTFFYFRHGIFVLALWYFLKINNNLIKYIFYSMLLCFLILVIDGFHQYFFGENFFGIKIQEEYRISSFFGDELILGSYLSRLFPIFFGLSFLLNYKNKHFFIYGILFVLIEVLIFLSGERTAFFNLNLSAIFMILMLNNLKLFRTIVLSASFLLIILISNFDNSAKERVLDQTINQMNYGDYDTKKYVFSEQHEHHYISALKMFKDNIVLGVGVKNFRNYCDDKRYNVSYLSCSTHPHNTYIQFLSEIGILGFIFLIYSLLIFSFHSFKHLIWQIKKKIYMNNFEICLLSSILITIWPIVPSGNFFNNWLSIVYYFPVGFLLYSLEKKMKNKKKIRKIY